MRILSGSLGVLLVAGVLLAAPARASTSDGLRQGEPETVVVNAPRTNDYRLGTGDKVRVTVYDETDLSGEFEIDATGYVRLPLIGQVKAGGSTAYQLEGTIEQSLMDGYLKNPRVSVEVTTYRPFYIIGQVSKPGQYPYTNNMSALDAVGVAGGFTDHAVESTLYIRHEGATKEVEVPADETVKIRPGDVVRVDQTAFWDVASWLSPASSLALPLAYALKP
ncbi:MAG TPA: polysaccharide biosynthesis/export family protein [Rhizomicrobium sp.]|nr:polysaccharide biosynthesis/export family protein [Rhizomicrobium sp.]